MLDTGSYRAFTVNQKIFASFLFSRIVLKDIIVTLKIRN